MEYTVPGVDRLYCVTESFTPETPEPDDVEETSPQVTGAAQVARGVHVVVGVGVCVTVADIVGVEVGGTVGVSEGVGLSVKVNVEVGLSVGVEVDVSIGVEVAVKVAVLAGTTMGAAGVSFFLQESWNPIIPAKQSAKAIKRII